jgi:hypothetical protein
MFQSAQGSILLYELCGFVIHKLGSWKNHYKVLFVLEIIINFPKTICSLCLKTLQLNLPLEFRFYFFHKIRTLMANIEPFNLNEDILFYYDYDDVYELV